MEEEIFCPFDTAHKSLDRGPKLVKTLFVKPVSSQVLDLGGSNHATQKDFRGRFEGGPSKVSFPDKQSVGGFPGSCIFSHWGKSSSSTRAPFAFTKDKKGLTPHSPKLSDMG